MNMKTVTIIILLTLLIVDCRSQQETSRVYQRCDSTDLACNRVYQLFIAERHKEINHLWKFNLISFGYESTSIAFEQKIGRSFSFETQMKGGFTDYQAWKSLDFKLTQDFRYYYNLNRRARLGKRTNGFSGNYFSIGVFYDNAFTSSELISFDRYWIDKNGLGLDVLYGLQRRIGNIGFVDVSLGLQAIKLANHNEYNINYLVSPVITIRAGFAIDSFKGLKKALRSR
jgi:uncharacterized protein YcfL